MSLPAVRETLSVVPLLRAACGFQVVEDGVTTTVVPLSHCAAPLEQLGPLETTRTLSRPALEVLSPIGFWGPSTRAEIENAPGTDSVAVVTRLHERGFLEADEDATSRGRRLRYRLTTRAVHALGYNSLEALRAALNERAAGAVSSPPATESRGPFAAPGTVPAVRA